MEKEIVYSTDGEVFNDDFPAYDGETYYYSGTKEEVIPSTLVSKHTVDNLLESMKEWLYDEVGEVAEGAINLSDAKKQGLLDVIKYYVDENVKISCYKVVDIEEHEMEGNNG